MQPPLQITFPRAPTPPPTRIGNQLEKVPYLVSYPDMALENKATLRQDRMKDVCSSIKAIYRFEWHRYQTCLSCGAIIPPEVDMRRHRGLCKLKKSWIPDASEENNYYEGFEDSCVWMNLYHDNDYNYDHDQWLLYRGTKLFRAIKDFSYP